MRGQGGNGGAISGHETAQAHVGPMGILSEIFSWWGGNTWSNRLYTAVRGSFVGSDGEH